MDLATLQLKIQSQGIDKGKSDLQGLQDEASKAEKSAQRLDAAFSNLGKAIGGALAFVGVGASLKSTIDAITGFQDSMLQLQATSRATASEMAAMEKQARILGATSKYSASQAADAQNFLAMAGFKTGEVLAATGDVIKFASAANIGLAQSADIASNVLGQMKLPVSDLSSVMDTLISTTQSSNTNVTQLAEAFGYVGPVAAAAGVSTEELAAAIGVLGDAGIQGGRAGTGLQGVIRGLLNVTPAAAEAMSKYGLSIDDVDITTHGLTEVLTRLQGANISAGDSMKIFGSESASAALNLASAADRVGELTKANEEAAGRTQEVANILDSGLSAALKSIASAAEESMLIMGESGLASALQTLAVATAGVISNFNGLLPEFAEANGLSDEFTRKIEIASTGVKVLGVGLGALALTAIPAVVSSISALTVAMMTNPIGLLTVGVAAAITYMITLSEKTDEFNKEMDVLMGVWSLVKDAASAMFTPLFNWFKDTFDIADETTSSIGGFFEAFFLGAARGVDGLHGAFVGAMAAIDTLIDVSASNLKNMFLMAFDSVAAGSAAMVNKMIDGLNLVNPFSDIKHMDAPTRQAKELVNAVEAMTDAAAKARKENNLGAEALLKSRIEAAAVGRATKELNKALDASTESYEDLADAIDAEWNGTKKSTQATKENTKETDSNTSSTARNAKAVTEAQKAIEALEKERKAAISAQRDTISGLKDESASLRDQISTYGQGKHAIDKLAISRLEEQKAALIMMGAQGDVIELLQQEIEEREKLLGLDRDLDQLEEEARVRQEMADEAIRMNEQIGSTLTDALMRAFEGGKGFAKAMRDTVVNMFKTMVLRPILQPVMMGLVGGITGALGFSGAANAAQSGANALGLGDLAGLGSLFTNFGGSMSGMVQNLGGNLASMNGMLGDFGANMIMHADTIGNALNIAGGVFNYGMGALDLFKGSYGAGIGAIGGQLIGGPVGGMIGKALGGMLDGAFKGETRVGGGFQYRPESDLTSFYGGPSGGYGGQQTMDAVGELFKSATSTIDGVYKALGVDARVDYFHGGFESSKKGRGGTFSGGGLFVGDEHVRFGTHAKGEGYGGRSGSAEEMFERMTKDMAYSTLEAWQLAADQMPDLIGGMLRDVNVRGLSVEQAEALAAEISATVFAVNEVSTALEALPFDSLKGLTFDLTASLMEAAGGLQNLTAGIGNYYQGFYSEQERFGLSAKQLSKDIKNLGFTLPDTRDGFRELVESLDALDEANHKTIAGLFDLSGAAASYYDVATDAAQEIADTFISASDAVRSQLMGLSDRIQLDIMGSDEERYGFHKSQFDAYAKQLREADDMHRIQDLVSKMTSSASSAYNLLDEDVRRNGKGQEYIATLNQIQAQADERLEIAKEKAAKEKAEELKIVGEAIAKELVKILDGSGKKLEKSAEQIGSWAANVSSGLSSVSSALERMRGEEITL